MGTIINTNLNALSQTHLCFPNFALPQVLSHDHLGKDDFMGENIIELGMINWNDITTRWFELQAEVM